MTPTLPFLYIAAIGCIGLLLLLARHNERTGWVMERNTVLQDLLELSALGHQNGSEPASTSSAQPGLPPVVNIRKVSHVEAAAFSCDLSRLRDALRDALNVGADNATRLEDERRLVV